VVGFGTCYVSLRNKYEATRREADKNEYPQPD
jgi:hypothetical protein